MFRVKGSGFRIQDSGFRVEDHMVTPKLYTSAMNAAPPAEASPINTLFESP